MAFAATPGKTVKTECRVKLVWTMLRCILFCGNRKTKKTFPNITITIDRTGGFLAKAGFFFYLVRALQRRRCRWRQTMEACLQSDADRCNNGDDSRYQNKRVFLVFFDTPDTGKYWWATNCLKKICEMVSILYLCSVFPMKACQRTCILQGERHT